MKPEPKFLFAAPRVCAGAVRSAAQSIPAGSYLVDADALRKARQGVPTGEYHFTPRNSRVGAGTVRAATHAVPTGSYCVDADALRKARQGVPTGEYHQPAGRAIPLVLVADGLPASGCVLGPQYHCLRCRRRHGVAQCPAQLPLV